MRRKSRERPRGGAAPRRRGAASLDYILVLCVVLPMVAFMMTVGREILWLTYEMLSTLITWPFM
jgi:hypothetical protein